MTNHIVHIGVFKTASKWLQRHVFPSVTGASFANDALFKTLLENLTRDEHFYSSTFTSAIAEAGDGGRVLLSFERLAAGRPWGDRAIDPERNADRLAQIMPNAFIVLFTREAKSLAKSLYSQYVQEGGYLSQPDFMESVLHTDYLDMEKTIKRYKSRFNNVLVLPYEQLRDEPMDCLGQIEDFADVKFGAIPAGRRANVSLYGWRLQILRKWNRTFRKSIHNARPPLPVPYAGALRAIMQKRAR